MEDIRELLAKMEKTREKKLVEHKKHLASEEYQSALRLLNVVTTDFIKGMKACSMYCSRGAEFRDNSLSLSHIDDYFMSAIMIMIMLTEGGINPAKREIRYLIDSSMRYLFVDQQLWRGSIKEKLMYFDKKVDKSNIKYINDIDLHMIKSSALKSAFRSEYKTTYYKACEYVHASTKQIEERFSLYEQGITIGLDRAEQLQEVAELLSEVYSSLLVFTFHAAGVSTIGDLMVDTLSPQDGWVYNGNQYISEIDRHFDYKHERKELIVQLEETRTNRAWPNKALQRTSR
ncbi:hypothetical protein SAMN05216317_1252 [Nitrosomonas eutropha]|uniref:hypothetical protein n=1 Tax=Nitrosomonas eutropha TaxID=916 RepID=UPI0008973358|nr:hypothetical protein [Nitrosomonas eutropha]SDX03465.1 hypothetical protein SAMN05216317_1252 [Nitrosomonas eutropha]